MNYYKRNLGDFARDTAHLSQGQVGAYDLLLDWYYSNERPLPADMEDVYRIARAHTKEERKNVDKVRGMFDADGRHKRCDAEISKVGEKTETNRGNGAKGGRPLSRTEAEPKQNPDGFDSLTQKEPTHIPDTTQSKPYSITPLLKEEAKAKSIAQRAARFDEFWAIYPCRKGKAKALARWQARNLDAVADRIIADVRNRLAHDRQWRDGYIPHGSTYVNGSGWEDDIERTGPKLAAVGGSGYVPLPGEY